MQVDSESSNWLEQCAEKERKLQSENDRLRLIADTISSVLSDQIYRDIHFYKRLFPEERDFIEIVQKAGTSSIVRTGPRRTNNATETMHGSFQAAVHFSIEYHPNILLRCAFDHRGDLDREFNVVLADEGTPTFEGVSIAMVSEYLLKPVLFDRLANEAKSDSV